MTYKNYAPNATAILTFVATHILVFFSFFSPLRSLTPVLCPDVWCCYSGVLLGAVACVHWCLGNDCYHIMTVGTVVSSLALV